ncbi:DUF1643 domain-containing protein [Kroppenstedtia sanguinis]|uniref:DUF1643 domain-containing protein n=1 Tax=Gordonia sp. X0973 TaxID=2742602 RepID=UPI000F531022
MGVQHADGPRVGVILLNPARETKRVSTTQQVLEDVRVAKVWGKLEIANLVETPTRNSKELAQVATSPQVFLDARDRLEALLTSSDTLVFAWGVAPLSGTAGRHVRGQTSWVISRARHHGHTHAWVMGGRPRHPSRWRQYVGPQRGLFDGSTTVDRLMQGLERCALEHCAADVVRPPLGELSEVAGNLLTKRGGQPA